MSGHRRFFLFGDPLQHPRAPAYKLGPQPEDWRTTRRLNFGGKMVDLANRRDRSPNQNSAISSAPSNKSSLRRAGAAVLSVAACELVEAIVPFAASAGSLRNAREGQRPKTRRQKSLIRGAFFSGGFFVGLFFHWPVPPGLAVKAPASGAHFFAFVGRASFAERVIEPIGYLGVPRCNQLFDLVFEGGPILDLLLPDRKRLALGARRRRVEDAVDGVLPNDEPSGLPIQRDAALFPWRGRGIR